MSAFVPLCVFSSLPFYSKALETSDKPRKSATNPQNNCPVLTNAIDNSQLNKELKKSDFKGVKDIYVHLKKILY